MLDGTIIRGFREHDNVINQLHRRLKELEKGADKIYMQNLTHVMMWDVLMGLLEEKGVITKVQFDRALKDLSDRTRAAMEEAAKKDAEAKELAKGKVTVLSQTPAIPVVK